MPPSLERLHAQREVPARKRQVSAPYSEAEAKPDRRIDCIAIEVAVRQSIIDLREHEPGVSIELRRKPPTRLLSVLLLFLLQSRNAS
jgi:hypothetical protein